MPSIGTAYVQAQLSFRGVESQIRKGVSDPLRKEADKAATAASSSISQKLAGASSTLSNFGKKGAVAFGLMTAAGFKLADAAGDLSSAIATTEQIMGDAAKTTIDWSKTSVEAVGLSQRAALEAANGFALFGEKANLTGDDLSNFSTNLVTLAADMAAFKNVSPEQAVQDLTSALAGSSETMTKYGVDVREGALKQEYMALTGEKVTGTLTTGQRTMALYSAVMKQTTTIQGQFAREGDQLVTKQAKAKASIEDAAASFGEVLVPAVAAGFGALAVFAGGLASVNDATHGSVAMMGLAAAGFTGVASAAALVGGKIGGLIKWFGQASTAMRTMTLATGAVGVALVAAAGLYTFLSGRNAEARARVVETAAALGEQTAAALDNAEAIKAAGGEVDTLALANDALALAIANSGDNGSKLVSALGNIGLSATDAASILVQMQDDGTGAMRKLALEAGATSDEADFLAKAIGNGGSLAASSASAVVTFGESLGLSRQEAIALRDRLEPMADKLVAVRDAATDVNLDKVADEWMDSAIGNGELDAALVKQAESIAGVSREGDGAAEVYQVLIGLLAEMTPEQRDAALSADELAAGQDAMAAAAEGVSEAAGVTLKITEKLADRFDTASAAADGFSSAFDNLVGRNLTLQEAQDELVAQTEDLISTVLEAVEANDENALSLDNTTETGRANRAMVRDLVKANLDNAAAMLESGASTDEVRAKTLDNVEALRGQLKMLGFNERQVDDLIRQYNLTPDTVDTTIELAGQEAAKVRVEQHIRKLGEIPEDEATRIQALIDKGNYSEAEKALAKLAEERTVTYRASVIGGPKSGGGRVITSAVGNKFTEPAFTAVSEFGHTEFVLPVDNADRMDHFMRDPDLRGPAIASLLRTSESGPTSPAASNAQGETINLTVNTAQLSIDREVRYARMMAGARR